MTNDKAHRFLGDCVIGKQLIGEARKISPYSCKLIIENKNKNAFVIQRIGGKVAFCKIQHETIYTSEESSKIKSHIGGQAYKMFDIYDKKDHYLEGNEIYCECNDWNIKVVSFKKRPRSAHRIQQGTFEGNIALALILGTFTQNRMIRDTERIILK